MRCALVFVLFALFCSAARADFEIKYYLTITNTPAGLTTNLVANIGTSTTRNWTNDASGAPATSIQTTNSTAASATNLHTHLNNQFVYSVGSSGPRLAVDFVSSNLSTLVLTAPENTNLTITFGGNWARGHYVTNQLTAGSPMLWPTNAMSVRARTNAQNSIVNLLAQNTATNAVPLASLFLRNYTDTNTAQALGNKTLIGPVITGGRFVNITNGSGTNVAFTNATIVFSTNINGVYLAVVAFQGTNLGAVNVGLTNGYTSALTNINPVTSNLVNHGNAIRSQGPGGNSLQLGSNALAAGTRSAAIGNSAYATNTDSLAVGTGAQATNTSATAVGVSTIANQNSAALGTTADASGVSSTAIGAGSQATGAGSTAIGNANIASGAGAFAGGQNATASGDYAIAIGNEDTAAAGTNAVTIGYAATAGGYRATALGPGASAGHDHSTAIGGYDHTSGAATTTATNQVRLGTDQMTVSVPGVVAIEGSQTNTVFSGTNRFRLAVSFERTNITSVANGNNDLDPGLKTYLNLSGPTAAFTIDKIDRGWNGRRIILVKTNSLTMTIANQSGSGVLGDTAKIMTGTGANITITNNPGSAELMYDDTLQRWWLIKASN